jgi:HK97 family phage major capsid protein
MTASKATTDPRSLRLHQLYAFVLASQELLADAPRLRDHLLKKAPAAIRWKASVALMRGSGNGQPLGWLGAPGTVSVAPEGAQSPRTVTAVNVAKMFARMLPGAIQEAVWLVNSDVLPQLVTMTIASQPIWLPASGIAGEPNGYLFGRPVIFSEHCSTLGDPGDIQFVAPRSGYYCPVKMLEGDSENLLQFDTSMHLYFDYGIDAFRWTFRLGGQPYLSAPISPAHGADTKAHFVTLGARV